MIDSADGVRRAALRPCRPRASGELGAGVGESAGERREGEHREPAEEHKAPVEQVGDAATEQQRPTGHHEVGGDERLQVAARQSEGRPDAAAARC